jgi:glyoxylase-like metal-dependent hydrolase (beta-lactamase superfamily II)/rhodanese-related sulfurtransferase
VILEQYYLGCLAHASYLVADEAAGVAAVVDPQRDIDGYVADAEARGCTIEHVVLTHLHADFLAGHLELRDRVGAKIYLGSRAEAEYEFTPLADGDTIEFGDIRLRALETPGHSPESISILVFDLAESAETPKALLSGDTLFIGDVGRPDLRAALGWTAEELGSLLYDSIQTKILPLPDETLVYPAHGAGSLCGKHLSSETVSTIGIQRRYNYALQPMTREEFIRVVTADQPDSPAYFTYDAVLNTKERPTLDEALAHGLKPLSLEEVLALEEQGAQLLDARSSVDFAGAHLRSAVNIGLDGSFATWVGTLLDYERPIVVIVDPGREEEAAVRLGRIGFDGLAGYLEGGMLALNNRPELVERTERITAATLEEHLAEPDPPLVLDVRNPSEREESVVEGSVNIPLSHLEERLDEVPRNRPLVVHCSGGYRSSAAVSILGANGYEEVSDLVGGLTRSIRVPSARSA